MSLLVLVARWPTPDDEKADSAAESARVLVEAVKKDLKPRDIVTRKSIENAVARDHGHRRLDQRGAALPRHRARGRGRVDHRRLRAHAPQGAGAVRPQAVGPLRRGRPAPRRRHPAGDEDAARRRPAARRLHDHHRQDDRREADGRAGRAARRPGRDPPDRSNPMYEQGHLAILQGQPRARRLRRQDHRPEEPGRSPARRACSTTSTAHGGDHGRARSRPAT